MPGLAGDLRWPGGLPCRRPSDRGRRRRDRRRRPLPSPTGKWRRVDAVVDDPGDGDVGGGPALGVGDGDDRHPVGVGPVEVGELLVERAVDGGGHRQAGVVLGVERAHHGVVVDHVAVADRLVGVDDVADLGHGHADAGALGLGQHPLARHRAGRVARWRRAGHRGRRPGGPGPAGRRPARCRRRAGGGWESKVGRSFRSAWRDSSIPTRRIGSPDAVAAWPSGLGRGLQSPVRRFDSARRLQFAALVTGSICLCRAQSE